MSLFFGTCSALAQQEVRDLTAMDIEDLAKIRLATASRHLEDPRKAPAAISVVTHNEIVQYGWRTFAELLRSVAGIYTAYDRTYSYVGVRGFLQSGDYNSRILLLIDGHRLNENIYDSALIGTEFPLDLDLIDRVEIVRGPGSSLYGTDAELAVINVLTRKPDNLPTVEASSKYQSYAGRTGEIRASMHALGTAMLLSGSIYRSNGVNNLYFPEFDSPETNNGIARNLDGDRYDHGFASLSRGQLQVEALYGVRDKIVPNASYATNFNDPSSRTMDTRAYVDASYSHDFNPKTQFDIRAYYDAYRFWASYPYGGTHSPDRSVQINDAAADWIGFESVLGHRLGKNRIVAGMNGEYNLRVNQRNYYLNQPPFLDDNRQLSLFAIFGEAEINLSSRLSLNLGGRADWFSQFGSAFSPRIALMYLPTTSTSVKYVFNRAFRAPDPYDEFYVDNLNPDETIRDLQTERIQSHSIITEHRFNPWLRGRAVGYYTTLLRAISESAAPDTGATLIANGPGDHSGGLEFEMTAGRDDGWRGRASLSLFRTHQEITNFRVPNSPSALGKLNVTAPASSKGLLGVEVLYTGPQPNYLGQRIPSSLLTNLTLSSRFKRSGWSLSASCYDLFNRQWETPTGPEILPAATVQDGRTFRITLGYKRHLPEWRSKP
jgi:Outer membrane receptor for ferrienterochelin and colicins